MAENSTPEKDLRDVVSEADSGGESAESPVSPLYDARTVDAVFDADVENETQRSVIAYLNGHISFIEFKHTVGSLELEDLRPETLQRLRDDKVFFFKLILGIEPFDYQAKFLRIESKRRVARCGRQVGKTEIVAGDGLHEAATTAGTTTLILAPTQRQSGELFQRIKAMMASSCVNDWGVERETQTLIEFSSGARILCLPVGSDGANIRTYTADHIIVDEAAFVERVVFTSVLMPMLATTDGNLVLASTPFGTDGYFYEADMKAEDPESWWESVRVPSSRSPLIDDEFIEEQRKELSTLEFRNEILGEFVADANKFFHMDLVDGSFDKENTVAAQGSATLETDSEPERYYITGDIARHGNDATILTVIGSDEVVHQVKRLEDAALTESVGEIKRLHSRYNATAIMVDETGVGGGVVDMLYEDIVDARVEGVVFSLKTKTEIFNALKALFEEGELVLPYIPRMRKELVDLEYETTRSGQMRIQHPEGGHDDYPDSVALAAYVLEEDRRLRAVDVGAFSF